MRNTSKRDTPLQDLKITQSCELLDFLIEKEVRKSRNAIKSLLAHKQIKVNDKIVTQYNHELNPGDRVSVMKFDQSRKEKKLKGMKIVFEDNDIIVVDKEAGFLSVSTDKEKLRTVYGVLNEYVKKKNKNARVFVLHRLDREASGLLIFAKSAELQDMFQKNWNNIIKEYTYTAVVEGEPESKSGTIVSWLTENKNFVMMSSPSENGGLKSITHYNVVKSVGRYSLVDFDLETKRKNQLRVQMQSIGHPVVGDKKYGASGNPIKRVALHVRTLIMKHPGTGQMLELKSTLPKVMQQLVTKPHVEK
ncbi:RluA family pseudouridine synthase [Dysgonomonas sp. Marseille-P4677]|uniref:RluA family pseudouridine synthase n=1 Tax=Dysgonomonas sp. Marseille-P4677 TaxID=2364790 RepID=UPI0019133385|nr:RluA family pseudouridine synthase [Dysgonomonas sp. Marseille-P4677]MBK5722342.1 RluA family pseudouridine synthase [Dysgonomonas sp. Marseille-P4677]